jgi:Tfp pilus assembly PilM family ATPase
VKFRWPFNNIKTKHWVGINLSALGPSAVIYSDEGVIDAVAYDQEQGIEALASWIKKHVSHGMPTVLVLDDDDYELLLAEAPDVPDEELTAAIEFRIGDLLAQPITETAIQAIRLPEDAYRGRMSMAHVIASKNETIKNRVQWAKELHLSVEMITVPEISLLNVLAASSVDQGIALLKLGPKHGTIRLYQAGALYLTRTIEVGVGALDLQHDNEESEKNDGAGLNINIDDVKPNEINLEEMIVEDDMTSDFILTDEIEISELQLEEDEEDLVINEQEYVGFSPKAKVNEQQVQSLVLEVQRSLDYYESQLGMGQITQLWLMSGNVDLTHLVDAMQPALTANVEQPNILEKLKHADINIAGSINEMNSTVMALGGALAYVAS